MYTKITKVINKTGMHARPASDFVLSAKKFESKISIKNLDSDGEPINAKSMARILAEGISCNTNIEISADGSDEKEAVEALVKLIENGFGEN